MLAAMFSGRHHLTQDREGRYFIDRDGTHFRHILNFLRDGTFVPKEEKSHYAEILTESKFYGITGLQEQLQESLPSSPVCSFVRVVETRVMNSKSNPQTQTFFLSIFTPTKEAMEQLCEAEIFSIPLMRKKIVSDPRLPSTCRRYCWTLSCAETSIIDDVAVSHSMNLCVFEAIVALGLRLVTVSHVADSSSYLFSL